MNAYDPLSLVAGLNAGWLVQTPKGLARALISPAHAEGVVSPLYSERETAETAAATHPKEFGFAPQRVHSLWEASQRLAQQGFVGIIVDEQLPLFFVTTHEGSAEPTHVAIPIGDDLLVIDEQGPTELGRDDVTLWRDLPRHDRLASIWLLGDALPFVGYQEDMLLYEYLPDDAPQLTPDRGMLLEAAANASGAIALFSTVFGAEWFWENSANARLTGEGEAAQELATHYDVVERLEEIEAQAPGIPVILNPGRHRFYQGFFRRAGDDWFLVTINGVWQITPSFRLTQVARRTDS